MFTVGLGLRDPEFLLFSNEKVFLDYYTMISAMTQAYRQKKMPNRKPEPIEEG